MGAQIGSSVAAARAHEELFAYWASLKRAGKLPSRSDIHPAGFQRLLPTVSLIDVREDGDYRQRLAGTELYSVYGREITGRTLGDIYNSQAADYWRIQLDEVVRTGKPGVGVHNLSWRGAGHIQILWLRLPLATNGVDVDMILGYDAVVGMQGDTTGVRAA